MGKGTTLHGLAVSSKPVGGLGHRDDTRTARGGWASVGGLTGTWCRLSVWPEPMLQLGGRCGGITLSRQHATRKVRAHGEGRALLLLVDGTGGGLVPPRETSQVSDAVSFCRWM